MKIGIITDSHDQLDKLSKALNYFEKKNIQTVLFCGDFSSPFPVKKCIANFKGTVHAVYGNTEDRHTITNLANTEVKNLKVYGETAELEFNKRKVAITHYPLYAHALAKTGDYDAVFYGHQHEMQIDTYGKCLCVNSGEIAGFKQEAGLGIYDTRANKIEIVKLKSIK